MTIGGIGGKLLEGEGNFTVHGPSNELVEVNIYENGVLVDGGSTNSSRFGHLVAFVVNRASTGKHANSYEPLLKRPKRSA